MAIHILHVYALWHSHMGKVSHLLRLEISTQDWSCCCSQQSPTSQCSCYGNNKVQFNHSFLGWYWILEGTHGQTLQLTSLATRAIVSRPCSGQPVQFYKFVNQFFLWSPWCQPPSKVLWRTVFDKALRWVTWPNQTTDVKYGFLVSYKCDDHTMYSHSFPARIFLHVSKQGMCFTSI